MFVTVLSLYRAVQGSLRNLTAPTSKQTTQEPQVGVAGVLHQSHVPLLAVCARHAGKRAAVHAYAENREAWCDPALASLRCCLLHEHVQMQKSSSSMTGRQRSSSRRSSRSRTSFCGTESRSSSRSSMMRT
jgi:hypothetical protein